MQTEAIPRAKPQPDTRVDLDIRGVLEIGTGLEKLSKSIDAFPSRAVSAVNSEYDLAKTSYYSGAVSGAGIAVLACLLIFFISRYSPRR